MTIRLTNIQGITRLYGEDESGAMFVQFEQDAFAEQEPGVCVQCGRVIERGWLCLDGAEEYCDEHFDYVPF